MKCQHPLQFNPFFAAADDYAEILRHGMEQSRREKDADHLHGMADQSKQIVERIEPVEQERERQVPLGIGPRMRVRLRPPASAVHAQRP